MTENGGISYFKPSDFQMMKIESSLSQLCSDLALDDDFDHSYSLTYK